jgi:cell division protein FtsL
MSRRRYQKNSTILTSLNDVNNNTSPVHISVALVVILVIAGMMIGFIYQKIALNRLVISMVEIQTEQSELLEEVANLEAEKLNLMNMTRIVNIASNSIGMVKSMPFNPVDSPYSKQEYDMLVHQIEATMSSIRSGESQ